VGSTGTALQAMGNYPVTCVTQNLDGVMKSCFIIFAIWLMKQVFQKTRLFELRFFLIFKKNSVLSLKFSFITLDMPRV